MLKRFLSGLSAVILSISSLFIFAPMIASAAVQDCLFVGTTGTITTNDSSHWANCGSGVPQTGDNLVFNATNLTGNVTVNNDITNGSFNTITFQGSNSSNYRFLVNGNGITLTGGITAASGAAYGQTIDVDITAGANLTFANSGSAVQIGNYSTTKALNLSTYTLTISGTDQQVIASAVHGSGAITISAGGLNLNSAGSDFTSTITTSGTLYVSYLSAIAASAGITVTDDGHLSLSQSTDDNSGSATVATPITLSGDGSTSEYDGKTYVNAAFFVQIYNTNYQEDNRTAPYVLTFSHITLSADTTYNSSAHANDSVIFADAALNGKKISRADGSQGKLTVNGEAIDSNYFESTPKEAAVNAYEDSVTDKYRTIINVDYTKVTYVIRDGGNLRVEKDGKTGDVRIKSGGVLDGDGGTVGKLAVEAGGVVAPGHSPGCLNSGDFANGGIYKAELGGLAACTEFDQMKVTGAVDLSNGQLNASLYGTFKPKKGDSFKIIDNDGTDEVKGYFKDLQEGATFKLNDYVMKITYKGGDGNDVVLSVNAIPAAPDTGFGVMLNNPVALLATTTIAAFGILLTSRRLAPKKSRR